MAPAAWQGGWRATRLGGSAQCQLVLGFEAPTLADEAHAADVVAAALLGEGMSSPLLDEVRERRGLAYYVACSADILPLTAQFVVEGATAPRQAGEFLEAVTGLLRRHADAPADPADLARARTQLRLRALRGLEQPGRRLEAAAQDLFTFGRLRAADDSLQRLEAVSAAEVQAVFQRLLSGRAALGLAGSVPARLREQAQALLPL